MPPLAACFDARGCPVSSTSQTAIDHAEQAQWRLPSYDGDPMAALDAAIAADPHWVLPHVMKANALLSSIEHGLARMAQACLQQASDLAEVGVPLLRAMLAHANEGHAEAVETLLRVREVAQRFGGSHAQRDLIDQTLLDAAIRNGRRRLARHLLGERLLMKSRSPLTEYWARRIG